MRANREEERRRRRREEELVPPVKLTELAPLPEPLAPLSEDGLREGVAKHLRGGPVPAEHKAEFHLHQLTAERQQRDSRE